jgi:hypothetical protein
MGRLNYQKGRHSGSPSEEARPSRDRYLDEGVQTHKKRHPVKVYTPEEIEQFKKERGWK